MLVKFGIQSLSFIFSLLWNRLPRDVKISATFEIFKGKLLLLPINPLTARIFIVFGHSLLEDKVLHKEAWVAKLRYPPQYLGP